MKYFALLLILFSILYSFETNSQQYDEAVCPILTINPKAPASQTGGKYKPASNLPGQYFRVLVVFVQFESDNRPNSSWNPGQLPTWADDFINSQTLSEYTDMTISDYWDEMARGNYDFIGDVYPQLVILPPESYYYQNNKTYADCNRDVLTQIDPYVNFSLYDNWKLVSGQFIFSPGNSDKLVDMILMIYRNPSEDPNPAWFGGGYGNFSGISMLGFSSEFVTNDLNSVGQTIKVNGGLGSSGSGLTIRTGLAGHYGVMGLCNHEFGHYLFGYDHISWGGIMGGSTYALSGWERERLGYVSYTIVYQDNFSTTLSDFISTGNILKIPIPITNPNSTNFFLVENHQRLSHYDQITQGGSLNGQFVLETTIGAGIYITLNYYADVFENLEVYTKVADGDFDWVYDGDFYAGEGFYQGKPWQGWVPKTKRVAVNRTSGKNDRMPLHIFWNNHWAAKWCDVNEYGNYWLSRDVMGDDTDPFTLTNNVLFSPWSNPSSYSGLTGGTTNYSVWLYNQW